MVLNIRNDKLCETKIQSIEFQHNYDNKLFTSNLVLFQSDFGNCLKHANYFLSEEEVKRYLGYKSKARKHQYLLGRIAAKMALYSRARVDIKNNFTIDSGVFGQPVLKQCKSKNMQLSISHKKNWGAAILFPEEHPMAIDIENLDSTLGEAIAKQCTPEEILLLSNVCFSLKFNLLWSIKESVSKVIKTGLTVPFNYLEVTDFREEKQVHFQYISTMNNFAQFKILSKKDKDLICSLALPKLSRTTIHRKMTFNTFDEFFG